MTLALGPQQVGLLGELRLDKLFVESVIRPFATMLYPLLLPQGDLILSRSADHYKPLNVADAIEGVLLQSSRLESLQCRTACARVARYIVLDRMLNRLVRIADAALRVSKREPSALYLCEWAYQCISRSACWVITAMRGPCICHPSYSLSASPAIAPTVSSLSTRAVIEMDNIPLLFWRVMLSELLRRPSSAIVSPLLGGGLVAPIVAVLHAQDSWNYVAVSLYDGERHPEVLLAPGYQHTKDVILTDDNIGTGATLSLVRNVLRTYGTEITDVTAIEMHWEKYYRVRSGNAIGQTFHLADVSELSPFAYRHYSDMDNLRRQYLANAPRDHRTVAHWMLWSRMWLRRIGEASWLSNSERIRITNLLPLTSRHEKLFVIGSQ